MRGGWCYIIHDGTNVLYSSLLLSGEGKVIMDWRTIKEGHGLVFVLSISYPSDRVFSSWTSFGRDSCAKSLPLGDEVFVSR